MRRDLPAFRPVPRGPIRESIDPRRPDALHVPRAEWTPPVVGQAFVSGSRYDGPRRSRWTLSTLGSVRDIRVMGPAFVSGSRFAPRGPSIRLERLTAGHQPLQSTLRFLEFCNV